MNELEYNFNRRINQKLVEEYKSQPCKDCKLLWHPACMTFDHRGRVGKYHNKAGKAIHPSRMLTYDTLAFKQMLEGCDCVCSNCHKIREMRRDQVLTRGNWKAYTARLTDGALLIPAADRSVKKLTDSPSTLI